MGKAQITSNLGDGQYQIKVLRDTGSLDQQIAALEQAIQTREDDLAPLELDRDEAQAELTSILAEVDQILAEHNPPENDLTTQINEAMSRAITQRAVVQAAEYLVRRTELEISILTVRLHRLQDVDTELDADTRATWCADLSEDLTGNVDTIEIIGTSNQILLAPASRETGTNLASGQLAPVTPMTPAQAAFNFAIHPGWQKHKPTYRTGTIAALDTDLDTATVTLDPAFDRYQSMDINQAETLTGIPVEYMDCNATAFEIGDLVVVEFATQDWTQPRVVGFVSEPGACGELRWLQLPNTLGEKQIKFNQDLTDVTIVFVGAGGFGFVAPEELYVEGGGNMSYDVQRTFVSGWGGGGAVVVVNGAAVEKDKWYNYQVGHAFGKHAFLDGSYEMHHRDTFIEGLGIAPRGGNATIYTDTANPGSVTPAEEGEGNAGGGGGGGMFRYRFVAHNMTDSSFPEPGLYYESVDPQPAGGNGGAPYLAVNFIFMHGHQEYWRGALHLGVGGGGGANGTPGNSMANKPGQGTDIRDIVPEEVANFIGYSIWCGAGGYISAPTGRGIMAADYEWDVTIGEDPYSGVEIPDYNGYGMGMGWYENSDTERYCAGRIFIFYKSASPLYANIT